MDWTDATAQGAHIVVANVAVLFGVALFGWSASVLLVVYWLEAGVAIVRGAVQGLFAEHTPEELTIDHKLPLSSWTEKRGGVSVWVLPLLYPRNVPVVVAGIIVLAMFWPIAGGILLASIDVGFSAASVAITALCLVVGHSVGFVDYLANERYTDLSVRSALLRRQVLSVFALGIGGVIVFAYASPPSVLLAVVVAVKLVGDIIFTRLEHTTSHTTWNEDPLEDRIPAASPIDTFRASRLDLLARAAGYTPLYLFTPPYLLVALAAVLAGLIGGPEVGVVAGVVTIGTTAVGQIARETVQTAHLEYHVYPSRIVAYDTLLDTPQWTISRPMVTEVGVESSRLNRLRPGGRTVTVFVHDEQHRIRGLRRPEAFAKSVRQ